MERSLAAIFVLTAALVGCGGGGGSSQAVPPAKTSSATAMVTVNISVPNGAPANATAKLRRAMGQLASTNGIILTVYPHGMPTASPAAVVAADISATNTTNCTNSPTQRACSVSFVAPVGSAYDLLSQTIDQKPTGSTPPASYNVLAAGVIAPITIVAGNSNPINLTLNPVIASASLSTVPSIIHSLLPTNFNVNVNGIDADGNLILGNYVDRLGNPVTLNLTLPINPNTSSMLNRSSVSSSGTLVTGAYYGTANLAGNAAPSTLQVAAAAGTVTGLATMSIVAPTVMSIPEPNLQVRAPKGYDGATFVPSFGGSPAIVYDTTQSCCGGIDYYPLGGSVVPSPQPTGGPYIQGGVADSGTTLYFGTTASALTQVAYSSVITFGSVYCSGLACYGTSGLAWDPVNSSVYFQGGVAPGISRYNPPATYQATAIACGSCVVTGMRFDATHNFLWYVDNTANGVLYTYTGTATYTSSPQAVPYFDLGVDASSGNAFATIPGANSVDAYAYPVPAPAAAMSPMASFATSGSPQYVQPESGTVAWATETTAAGISIARLDTNGHHVGESAIGAAGGIAGPIVQIPTSAGFNASWTVLHFSGSTSAGELLLVTP